MFSIGQFSDQWKTDDVRKNYHIKDDEIRIASEVFAKVMEQVYENENSFTGKVKNLINFFVKQVKDFFRKLFKMEIPMSSHEVYAIANNIMKVTTVKSIMKGEVARDKKYDASEVFKDEPVFVKEQKDYERIITIKDVKEVQSIGRKSISEFTNADIQKTKKWANKYFKELGTKSPFFRNWFGDWRTKDVTSVRIVDIPAYNKEEVKNQKGDVVCKDTGWNINISNNGLSNTVFHSGNKQQSILGLANIRGLIENSVLLNSEVHDIHTTNKRKAQNDTIAFDHKLYAIGKRGDSYILYRITVEEYWHDNKNTNDKRFHNLRQIEEVAVLSNSGTTKDAVAPANLATSDIRVAKIYDFVKKYDKEFTGKTGEISKVVDDNGKPLVVYHGTESGGHYKFNADEYARAEKVTWFVDNEKVAYEYARNWESEQFDKEEGSQMFSIGQFSDQWKTEGWQNH